MENKILKFRAWTGTEMITPPSITIGCGSSSEIIEIALDGSVSRRNAFGLDMLWSKNPMFDKPAENIIIMRFTGFKDMFGVDIYEGDKDAMGNVVEFVNGSWSLNGDRPLSMMYKTFKVTGHIYQ